MEKEQFKTLLQKLLAETIPLPNLDVLDVRMRYDPNLGTITLDHYSLKKEGWINIFDEKVEKREDLLQGIYQPD